MQGNKLIPTGQILSKDVPEIAKNEHTVFSEMNAEEGPELSRYLKHRVLHALTITMCKGTRQSSEQQRRNTI